MLTGRWCWRSGFECGDARVADDELVSLRGRLWARWERAFGRKGFGVRLWRVPRFGITGAECAWGCVAARADQRVSGWQPRVSDLCGG